MKKLLLICCFLMGLTAVSRAQGGGRMSAEDRAKKLQTHLKLTDDQTARITAIFKAQGAKRDSIRTATNGDREAMMKAMHPMMLDAMGKIKAILTPEQATAFQKMMDKRHARMKENRGTPPSN